MHAFATLPTWQPIIVMLTHNAAAENSKRDKRNKKLKQALASNEKSSFIHMGPFSV